jgi:L-threonylcarbamoyladenylate synthase
MTKTVYTDNPLEASSFIKRGGVVAFPTETVYGLGADVFNEEAIGKLFRAKGRPSDNPLIAHVGDLSLINALTPQVTENARVLIEKFFPGPLTVVVKKSPNVPSIVTAGLDTIGIRMPANRLAHDFLMASEVPVAAPSANISGRPSPTTWEAVAEDLDGRIDCVLKGERSTLGLESAVVDCSGERPLLLRKGSLSIEQLRKVLPGIEAYEQRPDEPVRSPGLLHRHYSPRARVVLVRNWKEAEAYPRSAFIGLDAPKDQNFGITRICRDVSEYSYELFNFFRTCDNQGMEKIYCQAVDEHGIGSALMDRLKRASSA